MVRLPILIESPAERELRLQREEQRRQREIEAEKEQVEKWGMDPMVTVPGGMRSNKLFQRHKG